MHCYEAILAGTTQGQLVLGAGAIAAAAGTALGLKKIDHERIPQVAVLSATFFVVSLIHVPLPWGSVHLILGGLIGLILGWAAFPAVLVALALQVLFMPSSGLTSLGINTLVMALPAVVCHYAFRRAVRGRNVSTVFLGAFLAGATAIVLGATLLAGVYFAAGEQFGRFAEFEFLIHLPIALIEGMVTGSVVVLLRRVCPELLGADLLETAPLKTTRPEVLHG